MIDTLKRGLIIQTAITGLQNILKKKDKSSIKSLITNVTGPNYKNLDIVKTYKEILEKDENTNNYQDSIKRLTEKITTLEN